MNKGKILKVFIVFFMIVADMIVIKFVGSNTRDNMTVQIEMTADQVQQCQMFYMENDRWSEENSVIQDYKVADTTQILSFCVPQDSEKLRLDFGKAMSDITITGIQVKYKSNIMKCDLGRIYETREENLIAESIFSENKIYLKTEDNDPYIVIELEKEIYSEIDRIQKKMVILKNIGFIICIDLVFLLILIKFEEVVDFAYNIVVNYKLLFNLGKNDFKTKYAGSYFGIIWAFIQPIVTILVYWFVFQVAFNGGPVDGCPYVLWLMAGLIPWFFFQDTLQSTTNSLIEYSYLVKKVVFNVRIIPLVKIISAFYVHVFFVFILIFIYIISGYGLGIQAIQIIYYSFCMVMFTIALSYLTSAMVIFFRDLGQIIGIVLQIGIWLTPIMWNYKTVSNPILKLVLQLNPMFYIVNGYRESLITKGWIWNNPNMTIYFWLLTICLMLVGCSIFNKLKIHFADVL